MAEAAKQIPDLDLTAPPTANKSSSPAIEKSSTATTSGAKKDDVPVKEVILRKKFSWKNYPQVCQFGGLVFCSNAICIACNVLTHRTLFACSIAGRVSHR